MSKRKGINVGNNTEKPQTILSLYSGGGGLDIGVAVGLGRPSKTVCYIERDFAAISVLENSMREGLLDEAPVFTDSNTFDGRPFHKKVDWIIGGFPCQPFSVAGHMRTDQDERWLWEDIWRIICEVRPRNIFLENVSGVLVREGIGRILGDLSTIGFNAEWTTFKASDTGATHQRKRVFILAYEQGTRPSLADTNWVGRRRRFEINEERSIETKVEGSQRRTSATTRGGQNVDDTDAHGKRQPTEQGEQIVTGKGTEELRVPSSNDTSRQSNAGRAKGKPEAGNFDGRANNKQTKPAKSQGFHNLASLYDDSGRVVEPNRDTENDRRALVQERRKLLQLSNIDTVGIDQVFVESTKKEDKIRQRNDDDRGKGMDKSGSRLADAYSNEHQSKVGGGKNQEEEVSGEHRSEHSPTGKLSRASQRELGNTVDNEQSKLPGNKYGKTEQSELRESSEYMGNTESKGLQRHSNESAAEREGEGQAGHERQNVGHVSSESPFPPRPGDKEQWRRVIAERPDLAPALEKSAFESEVRGMADGLANRLDRTNRLRILGNGVVPIQSATAMRILVARIWSNK